MKNNFVKRPCPICKGTITIIGKDKSNYSLGSCGHRWKFKQTKSQKDMSRQYIMTAWGLEKII